MRTVEYITSASETTHNRVISNGKLEAQYSVDDFVNPGEINSNTRNGYAFVILDTGPYVIGGVVLAIVFPEYDRFSEQDALNKAAASGKLDGLQITAEELKEYETGELQDGWPIYDERVITLGDASEYFDQESPDLWVVHMSTFVEDPALMTLDRVQTRLADVFIEAEPAYNGVPNDDPTWHNLYRHHAIVAAEDALKLCFWASTRTLGY